SSHYSSSLFNPPLINLSSFYLPTHTGRPTIFTLFPYTTLFRSEKENHAGISPSYVCPSILTAPVIPKRTAFIRWVRPPSSSSNRSEEHTSELQSRFDLVCRLLLEKKKNQRKKPTSTEDVTNNQV